ncbi:acyltransferase family protein [Arthrobacter sp. TMN-37]
MSGAFLLTGTAKVPEPRSGRTEDRRFRPEVQGLRAIAVLMVVAYHIWFGRVSGGVDIFLLISAFLLTLSFSRKVDTGRPLDLTRHWLHQFKRLLPPAVVVILATLALSAVIVPQSRWIAVLDQAWASLLYYENWLLAFEAVDYYATDDSLASPFQHFWSLSVQGQVFILWPLLFAFSAAAATALRLRFRGVVLLVFGGLFLGSFGFSIYETSTNQAYAYFDTRARLWEFALGTLIALALPYVKLHRKIRVVAGWAGMAAMLSGGFILDVQGQFPGYVALWPLAAAALIILAGQTGSPVGVDRLLSWKPLMRMGDLSYALYLWHWPVLVLWLIWWDRPSAGFWGGLAIIAISLLLATGTTRFVERPMRALAWADKRRRRAVLVLMACIGLVAAPVALWERSLQARAAQLQSQADTNNPGAMTLVPGFVNRADPAAPVIPAISSLQDEWATLPDACDPASSMAAQIQDECRQQVTEGADRDIVVVGDSHAQQWLAAIGPLAKEEGWNVRSFLLGACSFGFGGVRTAECEDFNMHVREHVLATKPDLVFVMATNASPTDPQDKAVPGLAGVAEEFSRAGIKVIGVRDNPRFEVNMAVCSEKANDAPGSCAPPRKETLSDTPPFEVLQAEAPNIRLMDFTDLICGPETCPAVVGGVRVYIDDNHVSASYMRSLLPEFRSRFLAAAGW